MKKETKLKLLTVFAFLVVFSSCKDDLEVVNPNELSIETFFETLAQVEAAANATYAQLQTPGHYQRYGYILPDSFSDEMQSGTDANFITSWSFQLTPVSPQVTSMWTDSYKGIRVCNFLLAGEQNMLDRLETGTPNYTRADVNDALGQAHFLRGFYYYLLVKRYGGVPLLTNPEDIDFPRSTVDETYELITSDFSAASQLLYPKGQTELGRVARGTALAMLGKVLLHRKRYPEAKAALDQITGYSLLPLDEYNDNFNESGEFNDESMFEVIFTGETTNQDEWASNGEGLAEVTFHAQEYTGWANIRPSTKMIEEFEDDDPRLQSAILQDDDVYGPGDEFTNTRGRLWYKFSQLYESQTGDTKQRGDTNVRVLRFADVILMLAEVENELGNSTLAIEYLNQIRERVQLPLYGTSEMNDRGYPVTSKDEIFQAVMHERMVELCAEQHRYDDLVRWEIDAQEITVDDNGNSRGYNPQIHRLIPIPQSEIDTNPSIGPEDQNPGY